jgi:hypothetical protein
MFGSVITVTTSSSAFGYATEEGIAFDFVQGGTVSTLDCSFDDLIRILAQGDTPPEAWQKLFEAAQVHLGTPGEAK